MKEEIKKFLLSKRGYLKTGDRIILERLNINATKNNLILCKNIKKDIVNNLKKENSKKKVSYEELTKPIFKKPVNNFNTNNILVIGDLHEPFCLDGYLEFCKEVQEREDCGTIVFIGDVIDNHYSSYHETDPDGFSAGQELDRAIYKISKWYKAFPKATVIIGNHDRLVYRKAHTSGVSKRWIREFDEVLETPGWEFVEEITINGVNYNHGEGGTARSRMKNEMQSQVQGHIHSQFYIDFNVSPINRIFGMQVGCGVDRKAYAMAYGKKFKKPIIGCGVVKGKNPVPMLFPMDLEADF